MKKLFRKSISLLLALSLLTSLVFAGSSAASAAGLDNPSVSDPIGQNENYPIVVVPGLGMSDVALFDEDGNKIENDGTFPDEWRVLNLSTKEILGDIWKLIPGVLLTLIFQKDMGLSKIVSDYLPGMFK
ncbi:MAG TPA: hypothetical protein PKW24_07180, partial [Clostridiales bacterium]|nr:hypothetical protein [Clostridiales bacterium]